MEPPYVWHFGSVTLEVGVGDLLAQRLGAIVNSEQSDFVLASYGPSVSAQLSRSHPAIRQELRAQAQGRVLPAGTVLETSGPSGQRVFHAGFHEPTAWVDPAEPDDVALHAANIQRCVDDILRRVRASGLPGVAFPAIGTGLFRLPVATFARIFFEAVGAFALLPGRAVRVVLCLWRPQDLDPVVRHGTQALVALLGGGAALLRPAGGHALLAEMRTHVCSHADAGVEASRLLRFAETALQVDLAVALEARTAPLDEVTRGQGSRIARITFGVIRDRLGKLDDDRTLPDWLRARHAGLRRRHACDALARLVDDRNALAHHRALRPTADIVADVEALVGPEALPAPWPEVTNAHRWIRGRDAEVWLLDSVDLAGGVVGWRQPLTRAVETCPIA